MGTIRDKLTKSADIIESLMAMADEDHARQLLRFFKTGPGQYGEGDVFIGLRNPQVRMVVKEAWKCTPLPEAMLLVKNPHHEVRLCGLLIMVEQYLKAMKNKDAAAMDDIFQRYISLHRHINNWDLVDLSAIKIVGNHEAQNPGLTIMDEWIHPLHHTLWQQRIAMVSSGQLVHNGRPEICLSRAAILLDSPHDLLHKAAGWMLREVWKKGYRFKFLDFLEENATRMPAIMLSYATEHMPSDQRKYWQQRRKSLRS